MSISWRQWRRPRRSHQTGRTGLVAKLIQLLHVLDPQKVLKAGPRPLMQVYRPEGAKTEDAVRADRRGGSISMKCWQRHGSRGWQSLSPLASCSTALAQEPRAGNAQRGFDRGASGPVLRRSPSAYDSTGGVVRAFPP